MLCVVTEVFLGDRFWVDRVELEEKKKKELKREETPMCFCACLQIAPQIKRNLTRAPFHEVLSRNSSFH